MVRQPVLQIDPGERRRERPKITARRADEAGQLPELPMCRRPRLRTVRKDERQGFGIVPARLDPHVAALHGAGLRAIRPAPHRGVKLAEAEESLVSRPREPLRRYARITTATRHVHLEGTANASLPLACNHGLDAHDLISFSSITRRSARACFPGPRERWERGGRGPARGAVLRASGADAATRQSYTSSGPRRPAGLRRD